MSRASVLAVVALGAAAAALPALAQDRYGPSEPASPSMGTPDAGPPEPGLSGGPAPLRGRTLSWPGKQEAAVRPPIHAPPTSARAYAPATYVPRPYAQQPGPGRSYAARVYEPPAYPSGAPRYAPSASGGRPYAESAGSGPYARGPYPGSTSVRQPYAQRPSLRQAYGDAAPVADARRQAYAPPSYPASAAPSPDMEGWRPVFADAASRAPARPPPAEAEPALAGAPSRPAAPPASIPTSASASDMTPAQRAAAAGPPLRAASAAQRYGYDPSQGHAVRFYSVHRPFGLQPDAAPIPPQFFTATADLSQPAGPLPTDRTTTTTTPSGGRIGHAVPDTSVN